VSRFEKILFSVNLLIYTFLFVFSFSYVDLNLTLSKNKYVLDFVGFMQGLGYFNRPLATAIYVIFLAIAFSFFAVNLWLFHKSRIGEKYLKCSVVLNTLILIFAYPYLSSDLFNYIFDAKIIVQYHTNPYTHKPLDFEGDEWLRFMRWVHRYSPYGPLWLILSTIPAVLGFGKFILNFFAFKIFIGLFHLLNSYLIFSTLRKVKIKNILLGTAFYALNPLFLIEGVANAHNDIVLATFLILIIYFYVNRQKAKSIIALLLGVLIKYIPMLTLPWIILGAFGKKILNYEKIVFLNFASMLIFTFVFSTFPIKVPFVPGGSTQVQFQPWYLFWTIPYIALLPIWSLMILGILISLGASLRYVPFLFYGDWSHAHTILFMQTATILPLVVGFLVIFIQKLLVKDK